MRTQLFNDFFLWESPLASGVTDDVERMFLRRLDPTMRWGRPKNLLPDLQQLSEATQTDLGVWEGTYIVWVPREGLALMAEERYLAMGVIFFRSVPPIPLTFAVSVRATIVRGRWAFVVCGASEQVIVSGSALAAAAVLYSEWVNSPQAQQEMMGSNIQS